MVEIFFLIFPRVQQVLQDLEIAKKDAAAALKFKQCEDELQEKKNAAKDKVSE